MLELAKHLPCEKQVVLGYRDALFLNEEFHPYGDTYIATEDGSAGTKGNVLDAIRENGLKGDVIFACGPTPMLKALKAYAFENEIECYLSLEERWPAALEPVLPAYAKASQWTSIPWFTISVSARMVRYLRLRR